MADEADAPHPVRCAFEIFPDTGTDRSLRMLARNHEALRALLLEAKKHYLNASENMISIYVSTS